MNELSIHSIKAEGLLHTSHAKERIDTAEVKRADLLGRRVSGYLESLHSTTPGSQARVAMDVEDGFTEFCLQLIISLSSLKLARWKSIENAENEFIEPV